MRNPLGIGHFGINFNLEDQETNGEHEPEGDVNGDEWLQINDANVEHLNQEAHVFVDTDEEEHFEKRQNNQQQLQLWHDSFMVAIVHQLQNKQCLKHHKLHEVGQVPSCQIV